MAYIEFESQTQNPDMPEVRNVLAEEVADKMSSLKLVDVRRPQEYHGDLGHIPGAELIVLDELESRVEELPRDRSIVFICHSGKRSAMAAMIAQSHGYDHVFNLTGGMVRWNDLGYDTER